MGVSERPDPHDFLDVDALLAPAELATRERVRDFVRRVVLPDVESWYEAGEAPASLMPALGEAGLLGMHLEGHGCPGGSAVEYGLACLELDAGDSGVRSAVSVHGALAMTAISRFGSDEQREQWLPRMAAGTAAGAFALTEPHAGSDPSSMATAARPHGDDWELSGHKAWVTNGQFADVIVVWAKTDEGVRGFLVPGDTVGLTRTVVPQKLSLRASTTSNLELNGVRLPQAALLPGARGLKAPFSCLNEARYGIVWGAIGAARACFEAALSYSRERNQFGRPLASFQLVQERLATMATEVNRGLLLALHLGRSHDRGSLRHQQISMGKRANVTAATSVAQLARTVLGANGITQAQPVMRHMSNLETLATYEGTSDIHSLVLGEALTGLSAFRGE